MSQDIRAGRWDLHATAGTTPTITTTWSEDGVAYSLVGRTVTLYVGGTVTDPTSFTGATSYAGTISVNTATFAPVIPTTTTSTPLRLTMDGTLIAIGTLTPSTVGSPAADLDVSVSVDPLAFTVTLNAAAGVQWVQHDANATVTRPDTTSPVVWVGSVTPIYAIDGDVVMFVDAQAAMPTVDWHSAFNADTLGNTLTDGGTVTTWDDVAGSHDVTQATAGLRPVWREAAGAVPAYVTFSSDSLASVAFPGGAVPQPLTFVAVVRPSSVSTSASDVNRIVCGITSGDNVQLAQRGDGGGVARWTVFAGTTRFSTSTATAGAWTILVATMNGASTVLRVNGTAESPGDIGTNQLTGLTVGSHESQASAFFPGDIGEVRVYEGSLTAAEIGFIETALADKYGVTLP